MTTGEHHTTTHHNTTQHNTTQHNTTQHNTTQHNTTQHNTLTLTPTPPFTHASLHSGFHNEKVPWINKLMAKLCPGRHSFEAEYATAKPTTDMPKIMMG
jgi:hypothetical protein